VVPEKQGLKPAVVEVVVLSVSCLSSGSRKTRIETGFGDMEIAKEMRSK